jgi:hypothetical protein
LRKNLGGDGIMPKIPEIARKPKDKGMSYQFTVNIARADIESRPESHIQEAIIQLLSTEVAPMLLEEAMRFKIKWEAETEQEKKFFGKGKINGH